MNKGQSIFSMFYLVSVQDLNAEVDAETCCLLTATAQKTSLLQVYLEEKNTYMSVFGFIPKPEFGKH